MKPIKIITLISFAFLVLSFKFALGLPLRSDLNKANDQYKKGLYEFAERDYSKIIKNKPKDQKARFNLGNSLYKQNRFEESQKLFETLTNEARSKNIKEKSYYNLGNSFFQQSNYDQAITAYEEALKIDPKDKDAQHNLELAKMMQKMPPQQRKQQQDRQKQQQQQSQQNKQDQGKQDQDKKQEQQKPGQMSKEDAERLLRAIESQEKHKDKGEGKGRGAGTGKDW